jgi:mRNA-degrading endonuclease YafQ of YafQ-DinJ toxin-antitoxin module
MDLVFCNPKHEKLVSNPDALSKKYDKKGQNNAEEILGTIDVLRAAPTLFEVPRAFRPHPLQGDLKGYFAVNVTETHRIIFQPDGQGDPDYRIDNYKTIIKVEITEIFKDYH